MNTCMFHVTRNQRKTIACNHSCDMTQSTQDPSLARPINLTPAPAKPSGPCSHVRQQQHSTYQVPQGRQCYVANSRARCISIPVTAITPCRFGNWIPNIDQRSQSHLAPSPEHATPAHFFQNHNSTCHVLQIALEPLGQTPQKQRSTGRANFVARRPFWVSTAATASHIIGACRRRPDISLHTHSQSNPSQLALIKLKPSHHFKPPETYPVLHAIHICVAAASSSCCQSPSPPPHHLTPDRAHTNID